MGVVQQPVASSGFDREKGDPSLSQLMGVVEQPVAGGAESFALRQESVYSSFVLARICTMLNE
eukprot:scaffold18946_cov51-Isochrysis_galbana.AAC.1